MLKRRSLNKKLNKWERLQKNYQESERKPHFIHGCALIDAEPSSPDGAPNLYGYELYISPFNEMDPARAKSKYKEYGFKTIDAKALIAYDTISVVRLLRGNRDSRVPNSSLVLCEPTNEGISRLFSNVFNIPHMTTNVYGSIPVSSILNYSNSNGVKLYSSLLNTLKF